MVSVCLSSDALLQHLPSYLVFSYLGISSRLLQQSAAAVPYLGWGVSPHHCPSWPWCGIAPLGPPVPTQPPLLGRGVAPPGCHPWPRVWGSLVSGKSDSQLRVEDISQSKIAVSIILKYAVVLDHKRHWPPKIYHKWVVNINFLSISKFLYCDEINACLPNVKNEFHLVHQTWNNTSRHHCHMQLDIN